MSLIEDLCDTALMFDREERGPEKPEEQKLGATTGVPTTKPTTLPPAAEVPSVDRSFSGGG